MSRCWGVVPGWYLGSQWCAHKWPVDGALTTGKYGFCLLGWKGFPKLVSNQLWPTADYLHLRLWVFKWPVELGTLESKCPAWSLMKSSMAMTWSRVFSQDPPWSWGQCVCSQLSIIPAWSHDQIQLEDGKHSIPIGLAWLYSFFSRQWMVWN